MKKQRNVLALDVTECRVGNGVAFGTFGELLQGVEADTDLDFLVTFPIAKFSRATFTLNSESTMIQVIPAHKKKARKLAELILAQYELTAGGTLEISSDIPTGKGLASSSADLVATARAVGESLGVEIPNHLLQSLIRQIEPTDGVMYPGVVSFYHRKVELCEYLGTLPPLVVVSIDEGGVVDTVEFNKLPKPFTEEEKREYSALLAAMSDAVRRQDLVEIGRVATSSARMNEKIRPKRSLGTLIDMSEELDALGVVVAHSGTCLGILLSPEHPRYDEQLERASKQLRRISDEVIIYESWVPDSEVLFGGNLIKEFPISF
ncbi:MAG: GHMP family kinase ATP-binding protein [Tumebacillaceae bacterium]